MDSLFWVFSILNYFIVFGSLFYLLDIRPTAQAIAITLLFNGCIALHAIYFADYPWVALILSICLSSTYFFYITKQSIVFLHSVIVLLLSILVEYASLLLIESLQFSTTIHAALLIILFILVLYCYKSFINKTLRQIPLPLKIELFLIFMAITTIIIFYVTVFIPSSEGNISFSLFNFSLLLCYFLFLFLTTQVLIQAVKKEAIIKQKELAQHSFYEYMTQLEQMNREIQQVQHDYSNILLAIRGYIENENIEGLKSYFEKVTSITQSPSIRSLQQLENIKLIELKGLLSSKIVKAHSLSININVEIPNSIKNLFIESIDLVRAIGILFDNAVEACAQHPMPQIQFAILPIASDQQIIILRNTTTQNYIDIKKLFEENYSTKRKNRGIGLYNIKQLLNHYPNVTLNTYVEEDWFVQEMLIERKELYASSHM
ncbi:hypothetical protein A0U40_07595 [[Bacillus] sp. KCTC 13219]|nr:hypothetical protein A0U40_07595 [[Bacillus] sp. KCTC 13219]